MRGWCIGKISGITVEINYTWLFLFALLTWSLAEYLKPVQPGLVDWVYWLAGAATSLLFLLSVLLHELSHSVVARKLGLPVKRITLFIFGGVAQMEEEPRTPRVELLMTAAGPGMSLLLGGLFLLLGWGAKIYGGAPPLLGGSLSWLGVINLLLAGFNLLPGFPLDGGRLLRSVLWGLWRDEYRATRVATTMGMGLGIMMMIYGGISFLTNNPGQGIWFFFLGWLLLSVARANQQHNELKRALSGLQVGQLMIWPLVSIPATRRLDQALSYLRTTSAQPLYPVVDAQGQAVGVLGPAALQQVSPVQWPFTTVSEVMEPLAPEQMAIRIEEPISPALMKMARYDRRWLLVLSADNYPVGLLTEAAIAAASGVQRQPAPA